MGEAGGRNGSPNPRPRAQDRCLDINESQTKVAVEQNAVTYRQSVAILVQDHPALNVVDSGVIECDRVSRRDQSLGIDRR